MRRVGAVLLDVDGTLTDRLGGRAVPGAAPAVREIAQARPIRYVTNATSWLRDALAEALTLEGFAAAPGSVITPSSVARKVLTQRGEDRGVLIADPRSLEDLAWFHVTEPEQARAVLVATEGHDLKLLDLAPAVEALLAGARLYTLQQNRLFRRHGQMLTDLGPLAAFLGYAANTTWENLGKPSPVLFQEIAADLGLPVGELVMVGDDAEFDVAGALAAGCGAGVLVKTGKYRAGDEERFDPRPTMVVDSIARLPAALRGLMAQGM